MSKRGFTLIELLVVISIIGTLSSVVLSSTVEARIKALNAKANEVVRQYRIAAEIYRNSNGYFPKPSPATYGVSYPYALSNSSTFSDTQLNSIFSSLVSGLPDLDFMPYPSGFIKAVNYTCGIPTGSGNPSDPCVDFALTWYLKGNVRCPNESYLSSYLASYDVTFCRYRSRTDL